MKDFRDSISDYLEGKRKDNTAGLIDKWLTKNHNRKQALQCIKENLNRCHSKASEYQPQTKNAYDALIQKINTNTPAQKQVFFFETAPIQYKIAASLLLLLVPFSLYYFISTSTSPANNATWEQLATNSEFKEITLEDGTHVWLHKQSSLQYPTHFNADSRDVTITGEAFLDVAKETERPFLIRTAANSEIQVMGTALNIRSYENEKEEEIAVASGNVIYRCAAGSRPDVKLDKGNCAIWHMETNKVETMKETDSNVFSWKDHILTFEQADCRTFEKALERYFRVEVEIKDSTLQGTVFSAEFKDKNLQQILDYFNTQSEVGYEIKQDTCFLW